MYSVYAIFNTKHKKIYIGQSKDLDNRLKLHQERTFKNSYTSRFNGKWILIHKEDFKVRKEAIIREKQLKSYRGREFIRQLADKQ
ncbi:MAG: GIY-YIG nuclease family protein [Candidatus Nealsonbacteria bacterium]|nr:MAG: GIY-YIG nuclease family protein [Candidatus Nealsonbacteria bacterium]